MRRHIYYAFTLSTSQKLNPALATVARTQASAFTLLTRENPLPLAIFPSNNRSGTGMIL
jgi:hypothetical protein